MEWTGERMVPEGSDPATFWEHVYRYRFAATFVSGKRVLDIACGEGYGTAALQSAGAASVIGIDISDEACRHARLKYGIDARTGTAEDIPLADKSVDLVVSFETVEHVAQPDRFIRECARVLSPGGRLLISTPNKHVFASLGRSSVFHCSEMTLEEFEALVNTYFHTPTLYGQCKVAQSWLSLSPLTAVRSPWHSLPTALRVRNAVRRHLCPHLTSGVGEGRRHDILQVILQPDNPRCALANPYLVHRISEVTGGEPVYLIALAEIEGASNFTNAV